MLAIILLIVVFLSSMIKKVGPIPLPLWLVMLISAIIILISGNLSIHDAYKAIDYDIIFYLLGVFIIGSALEHSRVIESITIKACLGVKTQTQLLFRLIFIFGISSALFMNDTIAIIGVAVIAILINNHNLNPRPYIYALAFSVTIGSVFSPIGNPQNLLIASAFNHNPFGYFFTYLAIPSIIGLYICFLIISNVYRLELSSSICEIREVIKISTAQRVLAIFTIAIFVFLLSAKILLSFLINYTILSFAAIALISALPFLIFTRKTDRITIIKGIDYRTLIFFIGMFILMQSVANSGYVQLILSEHKTWLLSVPIIMIFSIILSQAVSNVPLVALLIPFLSNHAGTPQLLALAAGSTLAGNLTILGAASNIIIFQYAQKKGIGWCFSLRSFSLLGLLITIPCLILYWLSLSIHLF